MLPTKPIVADASESSGPQIEQIMPRLYTQVVPILGIALGILALGFALLYRAGPGSSRPLQASGAPLAQGAGARRSAGGGKEANERGRR